MHDKAEIADKCADRAGQESGARESVIVFEKLMRELQSMQGQVEVAVPLEADAEGFLDRECPAEQCLFTFKVHGDDWNSLVKEGEVFCPMCRHTAPRGSWHTQAQVKAGQEYAVNQFKGRLSRAVRADSRSWNARQRPGGLVSITSEVKGPPDPEMVPVQATEPFRLRDTCEACGCRYSFVGSAFFCPACGHNSVSRTFGHTLDNARRAATMRTQWRERMPPDEAEVDARLLREKAVSDIVTSVQRLAERVWEAMPGTTPPPRNLFQRLDDASALWRHQTGKGFEDILTPAYFARLKLHYQRRHLLAHCEGVVDADYVRRSSDTSLALGQRIVVDEASVLEFADLAERLGTGLLAFLPAPSRAVLPPLTAPAPVPVPAPSRARNRRGLSMEAECVARSLILGSETGREMDPQLSPDELRQGTSLPDDDLVDAVDELERSGLVRLHKCIPMDVLGFHVLTPEAGLFEVFDPIFEVGNPLDDARTVAASLLAADDGAVVSKLAGSLGWTPRRMNPALSVLANRDLVMESKELDPEWVTPWVRAKPGLRRFARGEGQ
ncbi:hypothetical protein [Belnapia rosea]|uniref:Uncharacterized protein n=1 Tax=Belnapia rosea TaxID=938405 RepID=A0A1G6V774_9PROT|nr:hypothetical protein [Belnapia rosea]SDD49243.1 hypothetical protein SAMN04487779_1008151 [Belnapia rosea]